MFGQNYVNPSRNLDSGSFRAFYNTFGEKLGIDAEKIAKITVLGQNYVNPLTEFVLVESMQICVRNFVSGSFTTLSKHVWREIGDRRGKNAKIAVLGQTYANRLTELCSLG